LRIIVEALYGAPERVVPALCLLFGLGIAISTGSLVWGLIGWGTTRAAWRFLAARLVITDLALGPLLLQCPTHEEGKPLCWLTFDDGPGPETLSVVRLLNERGFQATFFFIGEQIEQYPDIPRLARALKEGGHSVANHSWSHPNFLVLTREEAYKQVESTQHLLQEQFADCSIPYFRPPYGYRNYESLQVAEELSLTCVGWTVNSLDFLSGPPERVVHRTLKEIRPGSIILFHDGRKDRQRTLSALETILTELETRGYGAYTHR
jgi:peptidoglycan/xylan/chitin deacetylase (PgdA/CDA1 family)